ncbi:MULTISPECIES: hypothetical protein [Pseudomonas]|uniref:Uncharacterized protein n=1 Tax=Pseudomonas quercus TaxID=2722792 RepID=A0ABX0YN60_9PSED|nr:MULTISPECIES: hypothetical protein [Pseudomonas]MBF7144971.1 hypothetical protein [Pseudomonas sp. LY10J]NJP03592.1 hypothetical protein [Pseudomonas quercus]
MTHDEAMDEDTVVTRQAAERECRSHGCSVEEMHCELGDQSEYKAKDVLLWLGY